MAYKDGCSGGMSFFWKLFSGKPTPWESCCDEHDRAYERGGSPNERAKADFKLFACVSQENVFWALIMYLAVRAFGDTAFALSERWNRNGHGAE